MATTLTSGPTKVSTTAALANQRTGQPDLLDNSTWTYTGPSLTNGTGAGKVSKKYTAQISIAAAGSTTINLTSLLDSFGNSVAFTKVKSIYVELTTATAAASILVGNAANPFVNWITPATGAVRVRNGMSYFLGDCADGTGYAVVPATGMNLMITNEDAGLAATCNIQIVGE